MSRISSGVAAVLVAGMGLLGLVHGQETTKPGTTTQTKSAKTTKKPDDKVSGRLPNNYNRIGLLPDQKTKIYVVQNKYKEEIATLEAKLAELKQKQEAEMAAILNAEQRALLKELTTKKPTTEKPATGEKPASTTPSNEK